MKRIGILGGTFNPPHLGHLVIAEFVRVELNLEEVWFIPTYHPPHKQNASIETVQRVEMVKRAIKDHPAFKLNKIEVERLGKSYTIDTIKELKKQHPSYEFYFIIGGDMVEYLPNWKDIDQLIHYLHFVGVKRPGYQLESPYTVIEVEAPLIDISSSMIRKRASNGKSVKYLIPESVNSYIEEHQLYGK